MRRLYLSIGLLAALTGCAEFQFLSQASKQVGPNGAHAPLDPAAPDPGRSYKVGNSYQVGGIWYYPKADYSYVEEGIASWYGPGFHGKQTANGAVFDENKVSAAHRTLPLPSVVRVTNLENGRSIKVVVNDRGPFAHSRILDLSRRGAQLLGYEKKGTALVRVEVLEAESKQLASRLNGGPTYALADNKPEAPPPDAAPVASVEGEELAPPPGSATSPQSTEIQSAEIQQASLSVDSPAFPAEPSVVEDAAESEKVMMMPVPLTPTVFIQAGAFGQYTNANLARSRLSYLGPIVVEEITRSETPLFRVRLGPLPDDDRLESLLVAVIQAGYTDAQIVVAKN